jgi:hypothetical protein
MAVFWIVAPCTLVMFTIVSEELAASVNKALGALMVEVASSSETLVNSRQKTQRKNTDDSHLHDIF